MSSEVYSVTVVGNEAAMRALSQLDGEATKSTQRFNAASKESGEHASKFAEKVGTISQMFKGVSRDVDSVGGEMASTFARGTSDVLGMAEALGGNGLLPIIGAVSFAVGMGAKAWDTYKEEAERAANASIESLARNKKAVDDMLAKFKESVKPATADEQDELRQRAGIVQKRMQEVEFARKTAEADAVRTRDDGLRATYLQKSRDAQNELTRLERESEGIAERRKQVQEDLRKQAEADALAAKVAAEMEAARLRHKEDLARIEKDRSTLAEQELKASFTQMQYEDQLRETDRINQEGMAKWHESLKMVANDWGAVERGVKFVEEATTSWMQLTLKGKEQHAQLLASQSGISNTLKIQRLRDVDEVRKAEIDLERDITIEKANKAEERGEIDDFEASATRATAIQVADEKKRQIAESTDFAIAEIRRLEQAQQRQMMGALYASSVNATYSASMFMVGDATSFATSQLQKFGDINRDNYRELLDFTPKTIEAFAKAAQAAIFNMGLQAGVKSIFESGEALKEEALTLGSIFYNPAEAATHSASAATHIAAASMYGMIGIGAVGGSLAIGGVRGKGGLIGSGASSTGAPSSGGGSSSTGPSTGGGGFSSSQQPYVKITNVFEAGAWYSGDDQALKRTGSHFLRAVQEDAFERRERDRGN